MKCIECRLIIHNQNSVHINQIIAGFIELENEGIVNIEKKIINDSIYDYLEVVFNDKTKVIYETFDSGDIFVPNINWDEIDFYFKRSFKYEIAKEKSKKIYPLGLNYDVHSKYYNFQTKKYNFKDFLKKFLKLGKNKFFVEDFEFENLKLKENTKICFLTRFWNPDDEEVECEKVREERVKLNKFRAECIRACKKRYSNNFLGGVPYSEYAFKNYKDCIVNDKSITERSQYIETIKKYDICVATTGLHSSIGWKFAEYVAMGKVIISEPLKYSVPGELSKDKNYLEFTTAEELIENIDNIIYDENKRNNIRKNNFNYYREYLKPDKLILNTIKVILN